MHMRIIFEDRMGIKNTRKMCYLDYIYFVIKLFYKVHKYVFVKNVSKCIRISRSRNINLVYFNVFLSHFLLKLHCFYACLFVCLFVCFLTFLTFKFALFLHFGDLSNIWETNLKVLPLGKLGKPCLPQSFWL